MSKIESYENNLTANLKGYFKNHNFLHGVVGLSGGIDSALTLKISVDALGKNQVTAIIMPESEFSSKKNLDDAIFFAKSLGVKFEIIDISQMIKCFDGLPWEVNSAADMNIRARLRMCVLYHFANTKGAIVLGTGNKSEIMLGYGTKYGDFGVDIEVLGDLYKTEVFELAKYLNLPQTFINKKPSAELANNQTDEEEIGFSYKEIDNVLKKIELGKTIEPKYDDLLKRIELNKHKTNSIPILCKHTYKD